MSPVIGAATTEAVARATAFTAGGGATWVRSTGASPKQASTPASRQKASRLSVAALSRAAGLMALLLDSP